MIIVCHYNEIALKGKNRTYFEKILVENIGRKIENEISPQAVEYIKRISGRIIIKPRENITKEKFFILKDVFGITNFSFAQECSQDIQEIKETCWEILKEKSFETFRITASRSEKNFFLKSDEINREVGGFIVEKNKKKVRLKNPDTECFIELVNEKAFIHADKHKGAGGLPVNSSGKALVLLSGGIDSPVAAYFALKRGVKVDYVHFHSLPYTSAASNDKVISLAKKLKKFQRKSKIFMVPLAPIQKEVLLKCPEKLRIILYRRMMLKIAEKIAQKNRYLAIYTGESVAQVASQTLENIFIINEAIKMPIFRPLIGFDKSDIIQKAQKIGTYEISILPHEDCCTRFMPNHPETRGKLTEVYLAEEKLDVDKLIEEALDNMEIKIV